MYVFRPILQRFDLDVPHVLHVKPGGRGSSVLVNMKAMSRESTNHHYASAIVALLLQSHCNMVDASSTWRQIM